ncbi:Hexaprenyldihydroxybenzoate methyltransferase, mitochondrial [Entomophthora muscae]|uniref:Hexaprenyldihydroxybenzoate methyltransferase, mitochondrial n=1 Tax=Entomophthora muscae TaxID=34485 RepID=A0ACC2TVF8_9FUNG|nr:Hexaprenyldihydroxybenzoate methyltransferase, mitochondrial [Entomophthora muscae]
MSQEWWDPTGNFKLLHAMNLPRVEYILGQLNSNEFIGKDKFNSLKPLEGLKVLDVGCGGGILSESLARLGARVTAVDASHQNIAIAKLHKAQDPLLNDTPDRLQYFCMTSHDLLAKTGPGAFDIVCSLEVIEHVQQPQEFIHCLKELVCPNGPVFVSTINRNPLSYLLTIGMAEHVLRLTPVGTHHFDKYITPEELKNMMHTSGLTTQNMTNIHFNPLRGLWHLGDSIYPQRSLLPPVNYIAISTRNSD